MLSHFLNPTTHEYVRVNETLHSSEMDRFLADNFEPSGKKSCPVIRHEAPSGMGMNYITSEEGFILI